MSYETVIWEVEHGVGRLTLNRPQTLNAWNEQLGRELRQIVTEDARDDRVRAVLVSGAGRGFSSGADLKEAGPDDPAADDRPDELRELYHPSLLGILRLPKPVIAAVNGPAVGIGASLAFACDLIVAAESAFFSLAFVNIGLMPDGGATAMVPAAVGKARAMEMAMLGERVPARQALAWGLINRVVADDALEHEASELASTLAQGPTLAYGSMKRALNRTLYGDLDAQLELEAQLQDELAATADAAEGVAAFAERRRPRFTGSRRPVPARRRRDR